MLPTSLLVLTASFIAPIIAASSPSCIASSDSTGYAAQKLLYLYNDFCDELSAASFGTKQKLYDSPVILAMNFNVASARDCSLASCLISFKSLVDRCQKDDKSIWGTGSITNSCGVFSFDVWPPSAAVSLGVPEATIIVATMKTYDIASLTATSSSSSSSTSSSALPPLPTYPASTKKSSSITTSQTPFAKTWVASPYLFANSTSTSTSSTRFVNATSTGNQIASPTKPVVGPSTLGTSGAEMIRVGGLSLVVVATIFGFFL